MESQSIYESIATRTGGDIYIGVVGPVRTGKSTFIKSFMETMVLPNIGDMYQKERARDELPQSGSGKTIMTAEPKFVPEEAVEITIDGQASFHVRMIDCVGYMVNGAVGQFEGDVPRMVMTPWSDNEMPLARAAEIGTRKVITEHSTIGLVVTTDGSIGEIPRDGYVEAEERIVKELQEINKPFCMLLNCAAPGGPEARQLRDQLAEKYGVPCMAVNCLQLTQNDIEEILTAVLYEFHAKEFDFTLPEWVSALPDDNPLRDELYSEILDKSSQIAKMRDARAAIAALGQCDKIENAAITGISLGDGVVSVRVDVPSALFYEILSQQAGVTISGEGELMSMLCEMAQIKREYQRLEGALAQVRQTGYGIVMPSISEMRLAEPEIVKQGGKYGVKLRASAPSIHMIRAEIETCLSPMVGSEQQSEELVKYLLSGFEDSPEKIWESNIFGKSLSELVNEGLNSKLHKMPDEARAKLQETLERIINEGSGGLICIIL